VYQLIRVALPVPIDSTYDYYAPSDITLSEGDVVLAPFGKRNLHGVVVELPQTAAIEATKIKQVSSYILATKLPTNLLKLIKWAANYYQYPLGMALKAALPKYVRQGSTPKKTRKTAASSPQEIAALTLTKDQQQAVTTITDSFDIFKVFSLHGVTGSGKTEVYLRLAENMLITGKQVLILVPEIGLTPQIMQQAILRFGNQVATLHSGLADAERYLEWMAIKVSEAKVIIGTRSAIFAPMIDLGLIIVDEEHDVSYKQQDSFRYSARDLAVKLGQIWQCPVVLGSATPSIESYHNVEINRYQKLLLPNRVSKSQEPDVAIIDIRKQALQAGLSNKLIEHIKATLAKGEQVLLYLNRRGYAPVVMCHSCGWYARCDVCDAKLTLHRSDNYLTCHHCDRKQKVTAKCPDCNSDNICHVGTGTEKIEETVAKIFATTSILRVDRDSAVGRYGVGKLITQIHKEQPKILIGTQMLAKGHHFPNLTLVAILDIDSAFFASDFRALENMGQTIMQVAGRAGRGDKTGSVILQTRQPGNPHLLCLLKKGYIEFVRLLYNERKHAQLPPFTKQILLRAEAKQPKLALQFLAKSKSVNTTLLDNVSVLGPIPAPMERKKGYYRAILLLQSTSRPQLLKVCANILRYINLNKSKVRWSLDVDPSEII